MKLTPDSIQKPDEWLAVWLALGLLAALVLLAMALASGMSTTTSLLAGAGAWGVWAGAGAWNPRLSRSGARLWIRLARGVGRRGSRVVLGLMFYGVVWPAGRPGASGARARLEGQGGWRSWDPRPGTAAGFAGWATARGHAWSVFLIPFVGLLRALGARSEGAAPEGIYTLF